LMPTRDRAFLRAWRVVWPQLPLALVLIAAGLINVLIGFRAGSFGDMERFGQQVSFGALGSAAQIILGAGLVFSGIGLLWRVRVAWSFSILLLLITIGINIGQSHFGGALIVPIVVLALLIVLQRHFWRRTLFGNSLVSVVSVVAVGAYGTFGIYLLGNQFDPPIRSLLTALYFLVETLSTTGYGDYHPVTHLAEGFMITVWLIGLSVFATAVVSILGPALTNRMSRIFTPGGERRMHKDHVILVGDGVIASNTAHELVERGIEFVQLVGEGESPPLPDQPVVYGDASDDKCLVNAGIAKARMLIAAEEDDGENAFISLAAKDVNPKLTVLVIASSRRAIRRLKLARADMVFAPTEVGSRLLANLIEGQNLPDEFNDLLTRGEA
ncbi:MAG TPA: NAD-binding protein, partial [Gammaproteobacteria bacterium]|nr:NAD-binding protein [Gammaproteobacteria bacterium]